MRMKNLFNSLFRNLCSLVVLCCLGSSVAQAQIVCGENVRIETIARGLLDDGDNCVPVSAVDMIGTQVEVWIEALDCGGNLPNSIQITAGGQTVTAPGILAVQTSTSSVEEYIYRAYIPGSYNEVCISNLSGCVDATSLALYVDRTEENSASTLIQFDQEFHRNGCIGRNIDLDQSDLNREFTVMVPIHEKADDGREVQIIVQSRNGNTVLNEIDQTFTVQNAGEEASLFTVDITAGTNADRLRVFVCSPTNNGDSVGAGSVAVSTTDCPPPCELEITLEAPNPEVCLGETVDITPTTGGGMGSCNIQWQRRVGTSGTWIDTNNGNAGLGFLTAAGLYQYRAIFSCNQAGCDPVTSNVITITVNPNPDAEALNNGPIGCAGDDINIIARPNSGPFNYAWSGPNGFSSSQRTPLVDVPGTYTVTITNTDTGCSETASTTVIETTECLSIGSTIFYDDNNNGVQDPGEEGLGSKGKSVTVELLDAAGNLVADTQTDANGNYFFGGLEAGDYIVQFMPPASATVSSTPTNTNDDQTDGDDNGVQNDTNGDGLTDGLITSPVITLSEGDEPNNESFQGGNQDNSDDANGDMTIDFGLVRLVSVGSTVFSDDNNNGIQDPGEESLGSGSKVGKQVTLELFDANTGAFVASTTTDNNGSYIFENLLPGDYFIQFIPPVSLPISSSGNGTDNQVDNDDNGIQQDTDGDGFGDGIITSVVFNLGVGEEPTNETGKNGDKDSDMDDNGDMTIDFGLFVCDLTAQAGNDLLICTDEIANGTLMGSATGGMPPYTYAWQGPGITVALSLIHI